MRIYKIISGGKVLKNIIFKRIPHSPATEIKTSDICYDICDKQAFEGDGDYIDTQINLFDKNNNWSVLIDFTDLGKIEQYNSLFILHNLYEGGKNNLYGFNIQKTGMSQGSKLAFQVNNTFYPTKTLNSGDNTRLVIRYTSPNILELFYNDENFVDSLGSSTYFKFDYGEYTTILDCTLHLACWYNKNDGGVGRFWRGNINEFIIWDNVILTEEEIRFIINNKKYP